MSIFPQYFFAASNSYDGFVSYFDKTFAPDEYEKIFILKGGPGTGKSSFMKDIMNNFAQTSVSCEAILCSSDPKSLDGLILNSKSKKVAFIDGTAPHSTDPIYPGAIEKIINLGDFWNESLISSNREKILELSALKKQFYANAYQYLSVAKVCSDIVFDSIKKITSSDIDAVDKLLTEKRTEEGSIQIRLYSAFCKEGFYELPLPVTDKTQIFNVVGIYGSEHLFMEKLLDLAKERSHNLLVSPNPLNKNQTDSVLLKTDNILFKAGNKNSSKNASIIDTTKFINMKKFENERNKLETLYKEREAMLWSATDEFKKAYDTHLELEKIYSAAMNFKRNKKKIEKLCEELKTEIFYNDINT